MTAADKFRTATDFAGLLPQTSTVAQAANTVLYGGTIVTLDANARADVVTDGQHAIGVSLSDSDNRTSAPSGGGEGAITCEVRSGVFGLAYTGTAPTIGAVVYCVDNQTVSLDSGSGARGVAGVVAQVANGKAYVFMSPIVPGLVSLINALIDAAAE